eukprot:TRINITY_DN15579_c0_g1_i1.p1 TRINITY_DN15579_c0_g1~~TRINITY_DN15579_c0_g1_i1.p1  ORF type:complete len:556 (+),score=84.55 TRINITY_DN15579_c0_g1_i1:52-1719(+)
MPPKAKAKAKALAADGLDVGDQVAAKRWFWTQDAGSPDLGVKVEAGSTGVVTEVGTSDAGEYAYIAWSSLPPERGLQLMLKQYFGRLDIVKKAPPSTSKESKKAVMLHAGDGVVAKLKFRTSDTGSAERHKVDVGNTGVVIEVGATDEVGEYASIMWSHLPPRNGRQPLLKQFWDKVKVDKDVHPQCLQCNGEGKNWPEQLWRGCTPTECKATVLHPGDEVVARHDFLTRDTGSSSENKISKGDSGVVTEVDAEGFAYIKWSHTGELDPISKNCWDCVETKGKLKGRRAASAEELASSAAVDGYETTDEPSLAIIAATWDQLPKTWSSKGGITICPDPGCMASMQELVSKTWRKKYTRDRKKSGVPVPSGARVLNVLRIENHVTWSKYGAYARALCGKIASIGCDRFPVATDRLVETAQERVNEMFLFHGTNPVAADAIARADFDMERAGSAVGTMFGPGIYLAENASKSDEYAKEGDGVFMGICALLLCRAIAGRVYNTPDKGDHSGQISSGNFDSVCGDRLAAVGTFREMIFFDEAAVCPAYIVLYSRLFDEA